MTIIITITYRIEYSEGRYADINKDIIINGYPSVNLIQTAITNDIENMESQHDDNFIVLDINVEEIDEEQAENDFYDMELNDEDPILLHNHRLINKHVLDIWKHGNCTKNAIDYVNNISGKHLPYPKNNVGAFLQLLKKYNVTYRIYKTICNNGVEILDENITASKRKIVPLLFHNEHIYPLNVCTINKNKKDKHPAEYEYIKCDECKIGCTNCGKKLSNIFRELSNKYEICEFDFGDVINKTISKIFNFYHDNKIYVTMSMKRSLEWQKILSLKEKSTIPYNKLMDYYFKENSTLNLKKSLNITKESCRLVASYLTDKKGNINVDIKTCFIGMLLKMKYFIYYNELEHETKMYNETKNLSSMVLKLNKQYYIIPNDNVFLIKEGWYHDFDKLMIASGYNSSLFECSGEREIECDEKEYMNPSIQLFYDTLVENKIEGDDIKVIYGSFITTMIGKDHKKKYKVEKVGTHFEIKCDNSYRAKINDKLSAEYTFSKAKSYCNNIQIYNSIFDHILITIFQYLKDQKINHSDICTISKDEIEYKTNVKPLLKDEIGEFRIKKYA